MQTIVDKRALRFCALQMLWDRDTWYGLVTYSVEVRMSEWVRRRGKKTWDECVKLDLKSCGLMKESALDRDAWRGLIVRNCPTRTIMEKQTLIRWWCDDDECFANQRKYNSKPLSIIHHWYIRFVIKIRNVRNPNTETSVRFTNKYWINS